MSRSPFRPVAVSHLGFLCDARKRVVVPGARPRSARRFVLQDMGVHTKETLGEFEDWASVFEGPLETGPSAFGDALVGDFSSWTTPGLYRVVVPGTDYRSAFFPIHDGVLSSLPRRMLDYLNAQRCGPYENEWRGPCHLDDALADETAEALDLVGGWHDAGDTRQWMAHTFNPVLGLYELHRRLGWRSGRHRPEEPYPDDLTAEVAWAASFVLKMQDPATGMIWEVVGGGGMARLPPDRWWYENHAGCGGDNSENHFTDNRHGTGDERRVRQQYNPIVQYTTVTVLMRAAALLAPVNAGLAGRCRDAAARAWTFVNGRTQDEFHGWTAVRAWRALAAQALAEAGLAEAADVAEVVSALLASVDPETGFFFNDLTRRQPFRGILHSAQPLLALIAFLEAHPADATASRARDALEGCFEQYVQPLCAESPYGIVPYGLFRDPPRTRDHYRPWKDGLSYRFFMPDDSELRINHGLAGHWTSWAHALAAGASLLDRPDWRQAALDQIEWLVGANPYGASLVSGVGYNHPVPHSAFFGWLDGGVMNGPRGTTDDRPFVDTEMRIDWGSTEYWNLAHANLLQALAHLIPADVPASRKLGRRDV